MTTELLPRNLILLVEDYLKIIPKEDKTSKYRQQLEMEKDRLLKRWEYASPEEIGLYWKYINRVLTTYNTPFYDEHDWAKAIYYICRYQYCQKQVHPYLNILSHSYSKIK